MEINISQVLSLSILIKYFIPLFFFSLALCIDNINQHRVQRTYNVYEQGDSLIADEQEQEEQQEILETHQM